MADRLRDRRLVDGSTRGQLLDLIIDRIAIDDGCWEWTGYVNVRGYGALKYRGKVLAAHRVSYELFVGPIPGGLQLDHLCRNRSCVRPGHLEAVTARVTRSAVSILQRSILGRRTASTAIPSLAGTSTSIRTVNERAGPVATLTPPSTARVVGSERWHDLGRIGAPAVQTGIHREA